MIQDLKKKSEEELSEIIVEASAPTTKGNTIENLKAAIGGENYEYTTMYPEFAAKAEEEGLPKVAERLKAIAIAENHHEERYKKALTVLESNTIFKKDEKVKWTCRKCGYIHESEEAPEKCKSCSHPTSYFQLECEDY